MFQNVIFEPFCDFFRRALNHDALMYVSLESIITQTYVSKKLSINVKFVKSSLYNN